MALSSYRFPNFKEEIPLSIRSLDTSKKLKRVSWKNKKTDYSLSTLWKICIITIIILIIFDVSNVKSWRIFFLVWSRKNEKGYKKKDGHASLCTLGSTCTALLTLWENLCFSSREIYIFITSSQLVFYLHLFFLFAQKCWVLIKYFHFENFLGKYATDTRRRVIYIFSSVKLFFNMHFLDVLHSLNYSKCSHYTGNFLLLVIKNSLRLVRP